ncbi:MULTISPECIES: GTPase [Flavobacteriaceae]|uniref:GTPase n=1 Tax=Flavobacteriaceae TaxID=49546 RepID=UPI001491C48B|nr:MULTISPECIES: GTPase [Allomuricauda]MDC6365842.1 GTPase [Muricauda sp. AC10]
MRTEPIQKLVFVYNADSGTRNAILDSVHKIFSPNTYQCNLCDITYGLVSENRKWKKFRKESNLAMVFLHKDEFQKEYASKFGHKFTFPIVLSENMYGLEVLITAEELNSMQTTKELIKLIKTRI